MVKNQDLQSIGISHSQIDYENFWDWFIQVSHIEYHWKNQPTYLISQGAFLLGGILTFIHALINKQRFIYLWIGVVLHGLVVEMMSYWVPDIDNFWHSQTPITFLGHRLPLYIILLYPCFLYQASIAVAKLNLPTWSEPFAVGLCTVLIDIPFDIIGVNFLHWTWHDTDPNIFDRHYWVPWNSYYFHTTFAASFTFWFHFFRRRFFKNNGNKWESSTMWKEVLCTLLASLLGTPGGILMFIPIYHPLHDVYKLHTEVTFFILFAISLLIIWMGDRQSCTLHKEIPKKHNISKSTFLLLAHLFVHYASFLIIAIFFKAENEVSVGIHETVGPCDKEVPVQTVFGVLKKKQFLCASNYNEAYFDFHCVAQQPPYGAHWYTICGVPLPNQAETIVIVGVICIIAIGVFWNLHFNSFGDGVFLEEECFKTENVICTTTIDVFWNWHFIPFGDGKKDLKPKNAAIKKKKK